MQIQPDIPDRISDDCRTTSPAFDIDVYFRLPAEPMEAIHERFRADRLPSRTEWWRWRHRLSFFLRATGRSLDNAPCLLRRCFAHLTLRYRCSRHDFEDERGNGVATRSVLLKRYRGSAEKCTMAHHLPYEQPRVCRTAKPQEKQPSPRAPRRRPARHAEAHGDLPTAIFLRSAKGDRVRSDLETAGVSGRRPRSTVGLFRYAGRG